MQEPQNRPSFPPCFYRVSVKAVIVLDGKLLLVREPAKGKRWDLPGGGVEHHEEFESALQRELAEELNLHQVLIQMDTIVPWFAYDNDAGWKRPVLSLIVNAKLSPEINALNIVPAGGVEFCLLSPQELVALPLEKNIEGFRDGLTRKAFVGIKEA